MIQKPAHITRARAIILHEGKILLMHRRKPGIEYYALLGGKLEDGETPEQACVREVMEECGVTVRLVREYYRDQDVFEDIPNTHYLYLCDYVEGVPALGGEELLRNTPENYYAPMWLPIDQVASLTLMPPQHVPAILAAIKEYEDGRL